MLALFPATAAGSGVSVSIGPMAKSADSDSSASVSYDIEAALGHPMAALPGERNLRVALGSEDSDSLARSISFEKDFLGDPVVVLEVAGNWHLEIATLQIYDANGEQIDIRDIGVSYALDAAGWSTPGVTTLRFVQNETNRDMSRITIDAGGQPAVTDVVTVQLVP